MRLSVAILISLSTFAQALPPSDLTKDTYNIYSQILEKIAADRNLPDRRLLIASETSTSSLPELCVRPPKDKQEEYQQVLVDYQRRKAVPRKIETAFSIRRPYRLLTSVDVAAFMKTQSEAVINGVPDERFEGATHVFTLADVYFNRQGNLALTGLASWCGTLCGTYSWRVFEKQGKDKWVERDWVYCSTISRLF